MVAWDGWIDVTSRKTCVTFYRRPSGTVCFRQVSCPENNGETDKSSWILIATFLLKLSSQWVKYALACVYINLPHKSWQRKIVEKKGKAQFKRQSFHVLNLRPIQVDPNDISSRLIQTSNLISRTWFIFTMFNGPECFKQVTINFSNLCISLGTWEVRRLNWA